MKKSADPTPAGDRLRHDFLTSLSHNLRTPLAAIKIAIDGLFAGQYTALPPEQRKLVDITHTNIDRIVELVELELAMLQTALDDVPVARRLVDLRKVTQGIGPRSGGRDRTPSGAREFLFTDPERLRILLRHMIATSPAPSLCTSASRGDGWTRITVENTSFPTENDGCESGVCYALVERLGGAIQLEGADTVHIELPVLPPYDRAADLIRPMTVLQQAARLSVKSLSVMLCRLPEDDGVPSVAMKRAREFFERCFAILRAREALIRGRDDRTFYLGLLDRSRDDIHEIKASLGASVDRAEEVTLSRNHTISVEEDEQTPLFETVP